MILGFRPLTWVLLTLVVALAVAAGYPGRESTLPGTVRLATLPGAGPRVTQSALAPLCDYLGLALRRAVQPVLIASTDLTRQPRSFDLALVPASVARRMPESQVLAWAKARSVAGVGSRPYVIFPKDRPWYELPAPRISFGDSLTWSGGRGAQEYLQSHGFDDMSAFGSIQYGANPFVHDSVMWAVIHGAADLAILNESDAHAAVDAGTLDPEKYTVGPAGPPGPGFALVASPGLSASARRRARAAALNLDLFRYEAKSYQVRAVLEGMGHLGLHGFAPDQVLPGLRP